MSLSALNWNFDRKELKMIVDALCYYWLITGDNEKDAVEKLIRRIVMRKGVTL